MYRILSIGLAAAATTLLSQPVYADHGGHGGGGGGGGARGGGGGHVSAPAVHSAPAMRSAPIARSAPVMHSSVAREMRAPSVPRIATQSQAQFRSRPGTTNNFSPSVAQAQRRSFSQPQRNAPSVAFGGHAINEPNNNVAVTRGFATTPGGRPSGVPAEVSRGWDRGNSHSWNHHHYRFHDGAWFIDDDSFYGGYPYGGYDYGDPGTYSTPAYQYDYSSSDESASTAAGVQSQLDRLGYNAGSPDGVIGPQTRNAIIDFQNDHHLPVSGQIDGPLLQALGM